jgi:hypothetical protein
MRTFKPAPIPTGLERVRTLEEFEGPLLSEFKDLEGHPWLVFWADVDKVCHRWLFMKRSARVIDGYLQGKLDLRKVVLGSRWYRVGAPMPPGEPWLAVDIDGNGNMLRAWHIDQLPENYTPSPRAYHDPELAPDADC